MEIRGKLLKKSDIQQKTDSFRVQEFYLDCSTFDQYTGERRENILKFQVTNSSIDKLQPFNAGDILKVSFGINGRFFEFEDKETKQTKKSHAQNLNAYSFELIQTTNVANAGVPNSFQQPQTANYQQPQPTQGQMFDNYGNAPTNQQEDELELPF
ncbi:DUF3127 domain-containing protein [Capnocytophaga catalasegens]|uniref:Single-stranded DNA-binding protein n=1 Tax=Capnocytophaga catalasegens TaxID=1004260 RepID=A0AAV5AVK0_9FLAO|nr:DUF3127 domain-containing protein [Capnocytophaga catalasegens]GIZ15533.1 hypothetical protein RCZ03_15330 [Capnocytophaga catalasegens]GJM49876.1 hypothetical protein RCZ15_08510 [Capnocytophaga catalasegens]GJM54048.1 hypothetical protein RCZ16_23640 [Capnocytophaga catalasegens]